MLPKNEAMTKPRALSKEEFIKHEAEKCGVSVAYLKKMCDVVPCDCGHWVCRGWLTVDKRRGNQLVLSKE